MRNYLGIDPAALDRHILASPFDNERPSEPRRLAESVPDRIVAKALRQQIGVTWRRMHVARSRTVFVGHDNYADLVKQDLLLLLDVWREARLAVRR